MVLSSLVWLAACSGSDTADSAEPAPHVPDLPVQACGPVGWSWLPTDDLGTVVDHAYASDLSWTAETIQNTLDLAGLGDLVEPVYDVETYRVRYRTQGRGQVLEATGLVSFPVMDGAAPVVLWAHGTQGFTDPCGSTALGLAGGAANLLVGTLGYVVAAPDYLGMNGWGEPSGLIHPYLAPEPTAVASLDAVRAARDLAAVLGRSGLASPTSDVVPFGGSEGGFAALWADRYASAYAPELTVRATIALVPPTDVPGLTVAGVQTLGPPSAGIASLLATGQLWHGLDAPLTDVLADTEPARLASGLIDAMIDACDGGGIFNDVETLDDAFTSDFQAQAAAGAFAAPWDCLLETADLVGSDVPRGHDAPVYFQLAEDDDLVLSDVVRDDVPGLCDEGYDVAYLECAGAGHVDAAGTLLPHALNWLADRLAGAPLVAACEVGPPVDCSALE